MRAAAKILNCILLISNINVILLFNRRTFNLPIIHLKDALKNHRSIRERIVYDTPQSKTRKAVVLGSFDIF